MPLSTRSQRRLVAVLLALAVAGCDTARVPEGGPDAVVLIVIDTLRADRIGAMGLEQAKTPTMDRLAREGVLFRQAMTTVPVTLPAITSLLTGRLPTGHAVRDNAGFVVAEDEHTLAERFREIGWRTGAVTGSAVIESETGIAQGFEVYRDDFAPPYRIYDPQYESSRETAAHDRRRAEDVTDLALDVARDFGGSPYFLMVHYFDVHAFYDPPTRFARLHPNRPYDGEISYVDFEIGRLLDGLGPRDPMVLVVADHGEGLHEHGEATHGFLLYESTLHVPLIVKGPGVPRGIVRDDPVSLIDLEPTLARVLEFVPTPAPRDGRALDWETPQTEERVLYAETFRSLLSYDWSELRALRTGSLKLIAGPWNESYDLEDDPHELNPLAEDHPDLVRRLDAIVRNDPPADVLAAKRDVDAERAEELASLGYVGGSTPTLREDRPHPIDMLPKLDARVRQRDRMTTVSEMINHGQLEPALRLLDQEIEAHPDESFPHHLVGLVEERRGNVEAARQAMQRAIVIAPDDVASLNWMAQSHVKTRDLPGALVWFERLADADPDDPNAHYNLGLARHRLGELETARPHLQRFIELAPDDDRAPAVRRLLEPGEGQ